VSLPIADHGNILTALPFVAPALLIVVALLWITVRDRLGGGDSDGAGDPE
jgi:hypothetical protein